MELKYADVVTRVVKLLTNLQAVSQDIARLQGALGQATEVRARTDAQLAQLKELVGDSKWTDVLQDAQKAMKGDTSESG